MNFDIDRYLELVAPLDDSDIDYNAFHSDPLDEETLRCLRYMHDVEFHTTCYLRDLLVTSAHDDPEITAFLAMWSYEEYWHGEAIAKVLAHHAETNGRERIAATRRRVGRERLTTLAMMIGSTMTDHVVTVALTWGAVNEWTTQAGYLQLAKRSGHPVLAELLRRIAKQEGRHIDFYASQASRRLAESAGARRLTRLALRRRWRPVGSGVMPEVETEFLIAHLFGGDDGASMVDRIDRRLARLPGLERLHLVASARSSAVHAAP
ncbi:ferritin-like domain-containing protein [Ilumatobacter sp.]|uniref:ferritin-like domain-containing protein n=1 Tax=Ilumatobacter sp. TaxID=1967498 RepID=UPI003C636593